MIKRADDQDFYPNLTAAKPRANGPNRISRLVELLIKQYEIQAQLKQQQNSARPATAGAAPIAEVKTDRATQATFNWYE